MSKRLLTVLVTLAVLATSNAFASRAKQLVMGTGDPLGINTRGSLFYDDMNNIFYNPSYANDFKNWAIVEKSNGGAAGATAEGGFMGTFSNFNLGLYMNRGGAVEGAGYAGAADMKPIDLIFASDMGIKWGLGLTYAGQRDSDTVEDTEMSLNLGAQVMDFEPFVNLMLTGKGKGSGGPGDNKNTNMRIGTRYKWGEWTPYALYHQMKSTMAAAAAIETTATNWGLGIGRNMKIADAKLNYAIGYWRNVTQTKVGTVITTKPDTTVVPIDMNVEGDFTSWLTGRAGLSYNLMHRTSNLTVADATTGRVGATLHFGKADLDWAVGHVTSGAGAAAGDFDGDGFDFANGFFTAASLKYTW